MTDFSTDFIAGQQDCIKGIEHKAGDSTDYDRGYSTQYELEQIKTELNLRNDHDYHRPTQTAV